MDFSNWNNNILALLAGLYYVVVAVLGFFGISWGLDIPFFPW